LPDTYIHTSIYIYIYIDTFLTSNICSWHPYQLVLLSLITVIIFHITSHFFSYVRLQDLTAIVTNVVILCYMAPYCPYMNRSLTLSSRLQYAVFIIG
jgi:hypothetical protein